MDKLNIEARLEALLFVHGEPVTLEKVGEFLSATNEETRLAINNLEKQLAEPGRGLVLLKNNNQIQLVTKPGLGDIIKKITEDEFRAELTPAASETIAILSYGGPLTKPEIEYIRGINSSYILRNLALRGLVEKRDKKYTVSFELLKQLGITKPEQLPEYERYQELIKKFKTGNALSQP